MAKTSGGVPADRSVFSFVQYESQSETSTLTVMLGLAVWKSATIWFHTSSSAGSPHIIMLISTGPVLAAGAGAPQAASTRLATTTTNKNFFMLLSFLEIQFDYC